MISKQSVLYLYDGEIKFTAGEWSESDSYVLIRYDEPETEFSGFELPELNREQFYALVSGVEYAMGWKRDE